MSAPHIFILGDQTQNFTPELRKLLTIDNKPILTAFLEQAHYVIHAQANLWLPPQQRRQFKSASLAELLHKYSEGSLTSAFQVPLHCLTQLASFISHYEEPSRTYPAPKDTYIVGLCTGSLAAAAISCASSLSQLLPVALHTVQVALRLGLLANDLKDRLSQSEFDKTREWSAILVNADEAAALEALAQFNAQNTPSNLTYPVMPQRKNAKKPSNEADIQLAVQAIKRDATLSQRRAAKIYRISQSTLMIFSLRYCKKPRIERREGVKIGTSGFACTRLIKTFGMNLRTQSARQRVRRL